MIRVEIPNNQTLELEYAVFDFNGTIGTDGKIDEGVKEKMARLSERLKIYVVSLDTFGTVKKECEGMPVEVMIVPAEEGGMGKKKFVEALGTEKTVCIGNGNNDVEMFQTAALSLAVTGHEGASIAAVTYADVLFNNSLDALDFLLKDKRIKATLRK